MKTLYDSISALSLKEMDGSLLSAAIMFEAEQANVKNLPDLQDAINIASYLHRNDTRQTRGNLPKDTYITHPLRNTLRLIRYGITDSDVIIASVLHDTVEDHAPEIVVDLAGMDQGSAFECRNQAFTFLSGRFGFEVARIVKAVSNPLPVDGVKLSKDEKRVAYAQHIQKVVHNDFPVFLVKFADFYDNAGSLHHTNSPSNKGMTAHLASKYSLVVPVFEKAYFDLVPESGLSLEGQQEMFKHFLAVKDRLVELSS